MSVPNIEKLFQYLQCVAKEPINFGGRVDDLKLHEPIIIGDKIEEIKLSPSFFYTDNCHMCGGCDPAESNVYTQSEYDSIQNCTEEIFDAAGLHFEYLEKLRAGLTQEIYSINGENITVWVYPQEHNELYLPTRNKVMPRCSWCFQDDEKHFKCRIHPVESITCIMPHLRIFHTKGSNRSSIGISQFGRNWLLNCPVKFSNPENSDQFELNKQNRIAKLKRLNQVGLDLNIETYILEVIQFIENIEFNNYESYLSINTLRQKIKQHKLF